MHENLLGWRRYRYLVVSVILVSLCAVLFASQYGDVAQPPNGGTWQGYVLGGGAVLLVVVLTALGFRKRSYRSTFGTVQGWTSAHVYLGIALPVIATLHCAGQFGFNVHTLAYVLLLLVCGSGLYGLYAYLHLPGRVVANARDRTRAEWFGEADALDQRIRQVASGCDASLQAMTLSALDRTRIGGSMWAQLTGRDYSEVALSEAGIAAGGVERNADQGAVIERLSRRIPDARLAAEAAALNELLDLFGRRRVVLQALRRDIRLDALLRIWLYLHIPLTVALLAALAAHVLAVFTYW